MLKNQTIRSRILFWMLFLALAALLSISTLFAGAESGVLADDQAVNAGTETLKAKDEDGLPLPENYTEYSGEKSRYFRKMDAVSPSPLKAVLEFYLRELKAGKWRNTTGPASAVGNNASLTFDNAKGERLVLKLTRNTAGNTEISLVVKSEGTAKKDGVLPSPGKTRIYLGNTTDNQVVFTINRQKIVLKKESTSDNSMKDAPFLEVPPGKYPLTLDKPGQAAIKDTMEVGSDEIWGLIAAPGGALPLQMY